MRNRFIVTAVAFATLLQACSTSGPVKEPDGVSLDRPQAFIPFANQRSSIYSFQADGREGLWVEDAKHEWYYGKFLGPCIGIENAVGLGFDTGTSDRLDRYSYVLVPGERDRCPLSSFTKSDPPPDGDRRTLGSEEVKK
jgi:Family of unknown function (DUF6491)